MKGWQCRGWFSWDSKPFCLPNGFLDRQVGTVDPSQDEQREEKAHDRDSQGEVPPEKRLLDAHVRAEIQGCRVGGEKNRVGRGEPADPLLNSRVFVNDDLSKELPGLDVGGVHPAGRAR